MFLFLFFVIAYTDAYALIFDFHLFSLSDIAIDWIVHSAWPHRFDDVFFFSH